MTPDHDKLKQLDHSYLWHPFTQMQEWLGEEPCIISRADVLEPLAAHGVADEGLLAAELARDDTASGKRHQVRCLAARPSAAVKAQAWAQLVESDALSNALVEATIAGFGQSSQRELLAPYAQKYFAVIGRIWSERSIQIAMNVVKGLFPDLQDSPETLAAADAWLAAHASAPPALRRLVLEGRDDLARALRAQEALPKD